MLKFKRWWVVCSMVLSLVGCGGGGSDGSSSPPPQPQPSTGSVRGLVVSSDTGSPLANATVETGGKRATTDANGVFTLSDLAVTTRAVLAVRADGYGKGFGVAEVLANTTTPVSVRLALASPPQTFAANAAAMLTAPGSAAQVQLPADALVVASTGAAATGSLTARITPINPARDPGSMPGDYTSSTIPTAAAPVASATACA